MIEKLRVNSRGQAKGGISSRLLVSSAASLLVPAESGAC